ncbi:MAG: hypothetical protein U1E49_03930 [Hyphomicrobiaceae bacterium]
MRVGGLAHRILLFISIVIVLAAASVAAYVGLLGDRVAIELQNGFRLLLERFEQYADLIDKAVRYIGVAITAVIGILTLYKAWYYAETSLPHRLEQFISKRIDLRDDLRAKFLSSAGTDQFDIVVLPPPTRRWIDTLNWLNPFVPKEPALQFAGASSSIDASIEVLQQSMTEHLYLKASEHIAEGIQHARRANSQQPTDENALLALECFKKAIDARGDDIDALELAAKQSRKLHGTAREIEPLLKRLEAAAKKQGEDVRAARALRYQAELILEQGTQVSFDTARTFLTKGIDLINGKTDLDGRSRLKELGLLFERRAAVQIKREKFSASGNDLSDAAKCYGKLPPLDGDPGLQRVRELQATLERLKGDGDSKGD